MSSKGSDQNVTGEILSDATYDLLAVLLSKLEGLEAYDTYIQDLEGVDDKGSQIIEQIRRDDERHAQILRDHIEQLVQSGGLS
jgi:hypothetical protein